MNDARQEKLTSRLRLRDPGAFEQLIEEFQTPIFNLLYRMIGNREEAQDLLQEVFITVFKKVDDFRGESSLSTWIYRIATNHCINRKKYLTRRCHYARDAYDDSESAAMGSAADRFHDRIPGPDELAEGHQMERLIQEAMAALDEEHRVVVILRDVQNLSYEEIEEILQVAAGTVKSRLHRARMALKEKLAPALR